MKEKLANLLKTANYWALAMIVLQAGTIALLLFRPEPAGAADDLVPPMSMTMDNPAQSSEVQDAEDMARQARDRAQEAVTAAEEAASASRNGSQEVSRAIRDLSLYGIRCRSSY